MAFCMRLELALIVKHRNVARRACGVRFSYAPTDIASSYRLELRTKADSTKFEGSRE
jgi:hypothetical protein